MVYDMPDMMEHIKTVHEMTPRQYMDLFRKLESKFHWYSCGVCQSRVKHQKSTIVKHLVRVYNISAESQKNEFCKDL